MVLKLSWKKAFCIPFGKANTFPSAVLNNSFLVKVIPTVMVPVIADFTNKYLITAALGKRINVRALFKTLFTNITFNFFEIIHTSSFCVGNGSSTLQRRTATNKKPVDQVCGNSVSQRASDGRSEGCGGVKGENTAALRDLSIMSIADLTHLRQNQNKGEITMHLNRPEKPIAPPLEGFLRAKDIQRLFGIGKSTFYKWIAEGKLSAGFKLGERIKAWKRSEVENLMKAFETQEEAA
jgi:predicted DNA-binding transcriptional regulator AlpA